MFFDTSDAPLFRPPSEAYSFLLRVTRGCTHNKCTYCTMYRGTPFRVLSDEEVDRQISMAARRAEHVRRIFLADGNALVLPAARLLRVLGRLRETFPNLERVSSYAAPKDILVKTDGELAALRDAGLTLLYYGMESGDDTVLKDVRKGVDAAQSIEAGRKVVASGMRLSIMVILGLAGMEGSLRHAEATAAAVSAIQPNYLSALTLIFQRGSEMLEQYEKGLFHPLPPGGIMHELAHMLPLIEIDADRRCIFRCNHVSNYVQLAGALPMDRDRLSAEAAIAATELDGIKDYDVYNDGAF